ncbi:uncharacterized protein LOC122387699 [Amphibalanus amphitrite]|uniref:uncharacterized protein LOC122387699 n=1 Tax=Amphibalanus amphitrite TaxID=1232801 RepID=UPI001C90E767|nr:uncharacterized protein LOC122387699 [Amphibalanus amphitrite]
MDDARVGHFCKTKRLKGFICRGCMEYAKQCHADGETLPASGRRPGDGRWLSGQQWSASRLMVARRPTPARRLTTAFRLMVARQPTEVRRPFVARPLTAARRHVLAMPPPRLLRPPVHRSPVAGASSDGVVRRLHGDQRRHCGNHPTPKMLLAVHEQRAPGTQDQRPAPRRCPKKAAQCTCCAKA